MLEAFDPIYFGTRIDATFLGMDEKNWYAPRSRCAVTKLTNLKRTAQSNAVRAFSSTLGKVTLAFGESQENGIPLDIAA